ncbi:GFA family protein [Microvirga yunnanensis]|uniref:GFA family protein n=1 Tax=Microvirga yunnanensis TaxID=2953740 RepID=UPI0035A11613
MCKWCFGSAGSSSPSSTHACEKVIPPGAFVFPRGSASSPDHRISTEGAIRLAGPAAVASSVTRWRSTPKIVMICHCTERQTITGFAFRTFVLSCEEGATCSQVNSRPTWKISDSGAKRLQPLCRLRGSPIHPTSNGEGPKVYGIRVGTSRQRNDLVPREQIRCRSAQPWIARIRILPGVETQAVFLPGRPSHNFLASLRFSALIVPP